MKNRVNGLLVAGTDTGVGKTIITGCLARYLLAQGCRVITQKWAQSGCGSGFPADIAEHLKIMGKDKSYLRDYSDIVCPYKFRYPASPHLAAGLENKTIDPRKIFEDFKTLTRDFEFVIVESIGGVMVPLNKKVLLIDLIRESGLPVLIAAQNKLGAINHTLLTIEALRARKINILGIVFNNPAQEDSLVSADNPRIISAFSKTDILGVLPWIKNREKLYRSFIPIAEKIFRKLNRV